MPLESWQYHSYVPPSHLEDLKVRYPITIRLNTRGMEPHIKQRYQFSVSSFVRMFGIHGVKEEMLSLCKEWSEGEEQAPLNCLFDVDAYFRKLWEDR